MIDLTSRQIQILKAVVEEYINTAEAVGSETIDKKYNLGISPATIRNEMVYLTNQGYLRQPHVSAGRTPTSVALKLYVKDLMKKKDLSVADEVSVKEKIWENHEQLDDILYTAAKILADRTGAIGIALNQDHRAYHAGYAHLLNEPEFFNIDVTRSVLSLLEETNQLERMLFGGDQEDENIVHMIFGDELGNQNLEDVSLVFTDFTCGTKRCSLGVIGSRRLDYAYIIPMMDYFRNLITGFIPKK